MTFKIEKGVPLPVRAKESPYPFADMAHGDSFVVPVPPNRTAESVRAALMAAANKFGKAQQPEAWSWVSAVDRRSGGDQSVRIWRALPKHKRTFVEAKASAELASVLAQPVATPPPVAGGRVHKLEDGEGDDSPKRSRGRPPKAETAFAHAIPRFNEGGAARVVKGKGRY